MSHHNCEVVRPWYNKPSFTLFPALYCSTGYWCQNSRLVVARWNISGCVTHWAPFCKISPSKELVNYKVDLWKQSLQKKATIHTFLNLILFFDKFSNSSVKINSLLLDYISHEKNDIKYSRIGSFAKDNLRKKIKTPSIGM